MDPPRTATDGAILLEILLGRAARVAVHLGHFAAVGAAKLTRPSERAPRRRGRASATPGRAHGHFLLLDIGSPALPRICASTTGAHAERPRSPERPRRRARPGASLGAGPAHGRTLGSLLGTKARAGPPITREVGPPAEDNHDRDLLAGGRTDGRRECAQQQRRLARRRRLER